jgi:RNA polymerase sigma factor (sigma-70 family)
MHSDDETDDLLLLRSMRSGDDTAFWNIWQRYRRHLYEVSLRHMSGMQADADDAMSRSMLIARRKLPDYAANIENLEAWLTRLTCNVCLDIHREHRRAQRDAISLDDITAEQEPPARDLSPEADCLTRELRESIARAIATLPPRLRDVVRLRFLEEMSYDAIAKTLSITSENARKRVQQARTALQQLLNPDRSTPAADPIAVPR